MKSPSPIRPNLLKMVMDNYNKQQIKMNSSTPLSRSRINMSLPPIEYSTGNINPYLYNVHSDSNSQGFGFGVQGSKDVGRFNLSGGIESQYIPGQPLTNPSFNVGVGYKFYEGGYISDRAMATPFGQYEGGGDISIPDLNTDDMDIMDYMGYGGIYAYAEGGEPIPSDFPSYEAFKQAHDAWSASQMAVAPPPAAQSSIALKPYQGGSIYDMLTAQGKTGDLTSRKQLAKQLGITGYKGTADQNKMMMDIIRQNPDVLANYSEGAASSQISGSKVTSPKKKEKKYGVTQKEMDTFMQEKNARQAAANPNIMASSGQSQQPTGFFNGGSKPTRPVASAQITPQDKNIQSSTFSQPMRYTTPATKPSTNKPKTAKQAAAQKTKQANQERSVPYPLQQPTWMHQMNQKLGLEDARNLESGMITDKGTNTMHVIKNGKIVQSFPVLTGQARDVNTHLYSMAQLDKDASLRGTPTGTYFSKPSNNIYGEKGFRMNPIPAFGQQAPAANANLAQHITYGKHEDPAEYKRREALYNQSPNARAASYGCTNCRKPNLDYIVNAFPQGDTTMVIDSRKAKDASLLNKKFKKKAHGGQNDDYSGTYSAGVYYGQGGSFVPEFYSPQYGLPEFMYGTGMMYGGIYNDGGIVKGGEYDMSEEEIQNLINQGYKIQYI